VWCTSSSEQLPFVVLAGLPPNRRKLLGRSNNLPGTKERIIIVKQSLSLFTSRTSGSRRDDTTRRLKVKLAVV
jgi:hypothetical protein